MLGRVLIVAALLCIVGRAAITTAAFQDEERMFDGPPSYELFNYNPVANASATVIAGDARFTVLTDRLVRMEYAGNAADPRSATQYEDRPTLAFLNRNLPVPAFTHSISNGVLTIATKALNITYVVGKPFNSNTLFVTSTNASSSFKSWRYGDRNDGNLLGTIKSLDELGAETLNCTQNADKRVHDESLHCEWGVVSRDGWAVVNDTDNWALTKGAEWWDSVNGDAEDLYFFGHGSDYTGALADFIKIGGRIPMVPRYATGVWFTRWYDLNNVDVRKYIQDYSDRGFPLDVFVLDMNWHTKYHWGGYTPDPHLFPYVNDTFDFMHTVGLHTAGNLHDDDGVHNTEERFVPLCKALGLDPMKTPQVNFSAVDKDYVYSVEDIVLQPLPFDFWWIDWQQGGTQGGCAGGKQNPTIWTDKIRVTTPKRQGRTDRGLVLARWGGLGTHRYQVGFSGDVLALTWGNLAYQPYFSLTSSNVGYGFWSHDTEDVMLFVVIVVVAVVMMIPGIPVTAGDTIGVAQRQFTSLVLTIYPGASSGQTRVYEDDGASTAYLNGKYVWTTVAYTRTSTGINITISSEGGYNTFPSKRAYVIRLVNTNPPRTAAVNGERLASSRFGGSATHSFDGNEMTAIIETADVSTAGKTTITVTHDEVDESFMSGLSGMIKHATLSKRNLDEARATPGAHTPVGGNLMSLSSAGEALSYLAHAQPDAVQWKLNSVPTLYKAALAELINGSKTDPAPTPDQTLVQMFYGSENDHVLCGTLNCLTENAYYSKVGVEGYMPTSQTPFTTPLFVYWNNQQSPQKDNLVTTSTNPPTGYVLGDYQNNGQVFTRKDAAPGLIPLQLWYKASINDHMTLASKASEQYAKDNGYELVNGELGYIYESDPYQQQSQQQSQHRSTWQQLADARTDYSIALLKNAVVN
ncbi:hypothetical protein PTSG_13053 [Salpingoeca rosetta]|uniref:Uncharacterized protein n=1 Tax=Salpingoeca rosetta (strain ATCC 50818 / BSB-021) TaxID=946362 RepID=F2UPR6_SALR5|nr:uncharacterized protein PTSG_13053 [Salpingoeca rosetta]EGD79621.1 hypothetical protein PTSG_13053 [Salpingoeca rosetta]|eukprot:XP_004988849.1 hypothetical protein PTSG_13053 [Salpingoeca rosetta]